MSVVQWRVIGYVLNDMTEEGESVPAREIYTHPIMQKWYAQSGAKVSSHVRMIDRRLQERTSRDSVTVGSEPRHEPSLFDKTVNATWYLTPSGRQYVENQIIPDFEGQILSEFGEPSIDKKTESKEKTLPKTHDEARRKVLRLVNERKGQPRFRNSLLEAYERQCAITRSNATEALEAAHIRPFGGGGSMEVSNGLLLRADIHTLFDLNYLTIDPESFRVELSEALRDTDYSDLQERKIKIPKSSDSLPSEEALIWHNEYSKKTRVYR